MTGTVTGLFIHKSVPVIFEPPCILSDSFQVQQIYVLRGNVGDVLWSYERPYREILSGIKSLITTQTLYCPTNAHKL